MNKMHLTTLFAAVAQLAPMACAATEYTLPQLPDGVMPNTEVTTGSLAVAKRAFTEKGINECRR